MNLTNKYPFKIVFCPDKPDRDAPELPHCINDVLTGNTAIVSPVHYSYSKSPLLPMVWRHQNSAREWKIMLMQDEKQLFTEQHALDKMMSVHDTLIFLQV